MINREEIALFPAIEVECSPARRGLREVRLGAMNRHGLSIRCRFTDRIARRFLNRLLI